MFAHRPLRTITLGLALAGATVATNFAAPYAAVAQAAKPTVVGVVNAAKIFNELQETKDLKASMENKRKTLETQEFEKRQKLKDLQALRDQLNPNAPQYADRNRELQQNALELQVWGQMMQADVQAEQKRQMKSLFDKITGATAEVATAKGIDLVLAEQRPEIPDNMDQLTVDQLRAAINSRNVMYSNPAIDVSNDVIAQMDKNYKAGK